MILRKDLPPEGYIRVRGIVGHRGASCSGVTSGCSASSVPLHEAASHSDIPGSPHLVWPECNSGPSVILAGACAGNGQRSAATGRGRDQGQGREHIAWGWGYTGSGLGVNSESRPGLRSWSGSGSELGVGVAVKLNSAVPLMIKPDTLCTQQDTLTLTPHDQA